MTDTDERAVFAGRAGYVDYAVPETALKKWADQCLECVSAEAERRAYRFTYQGSTCADGGAPYTSHLDVELAVAPQGLLVTDASIRFADEDLPAVAEMCEYHKRGDEFLAQLRHAPAFCGSPLHEILARPLPVNPAGCFCTSPMQNHKWQLALSTIHYALAREGAESS